MEGRARIVCAECGRVRHVSGEMPEESIDRFARIVREDGFVPRPGVQMVFICGSCLRGYEGNETVDDEAKLRGT